MIKLNGASFITRPRNIIRSCQTTTVSKLPVNIKANKIKPHIGAEALAAIVIGSLGAVNCTKQETPDELAVQQITNNNEETTPPNGESVSYTQATLMSLPTPALRLDYICSELGFDSPIYYSKNNASVIKINNGTQYDEVYTQKIDGTDTSGSEIWLGGVNVHRNTGDVNTSNTGVQYSMTMKNGENGSIIIKKEYKEHDSYTGKKEGDIEIITITPVNDCEYIETTQDNEGNTKKIKIFHKDNITYRQDETGNIMTMEHYEEANNEMPVPIFFDPSIVN